MTHPDAKRWNQRYHEEGQTRLSHPPRQLLTDYLSHLPRQGLALDVAAGVGVNSLCLAQHGLHVIAADISTVALSLAQQQAKQQNLSLQPLLLDLAQAYFPPHSFDLIINFYYLERTLFPLYQKALKPGGWLIMETFVKPEYATERPAHYLHPHELHHAFQSMQIVHSKLLTRLSRNGQEPIEQLVARKK
ncbi:class I SAM-dependent methyltransferase [Anaerolineales bacterium HSG6]|nr:class I SAM-dependent methyltransferase [Anaerolineales bacterium HSG6]MDM8529754.1 class I SAM-dependent methyltransferase [Anaerolineales bacterium HSG25]